MIRYALAAQALKFFSLSPATRALYRRLGNVAGSRKRSAELINPAYIERANYQLRILRENGAIRDGMHTLELGTGWIHWESVFLRLHCDIRATLYDVWDNRQFGAFIAMVSELKSRVLARNEIEVAPQRMGVIVPLLEQVLETRSFEEAYALLGFNYVLEPAGTLAGFASDRFDLVFSSDVLEHVEASTLRPYVSDIARILKPGGYSYHQVVPSDHLTMYDNSVNGKNYLQYSDKIWQLLFANKVQYQNRVPRSHYLSCFDETELALKYDEIVGRVDVSSLNIAAQFRDLHPDDLETTVFRILHGKPAAAGVCAA